MSAQNDIHLNDEQLIWAVIDEKELTVEDRRHLQECVICNEKVTSFRAELQGFGEYARTSVPPLSKDMVLPQVEQTSASGMLDWFPSFSAAVMTGLILFVYFLGIEATSPRLPDYQAPEDLLTEEYLMDEIFEMVENPLSNELYQLVGENDGFDDEFLQFVIPDIQDDFQS
jgi:hypothetical protein